MDPLGLPGRPHRGGCVAAGGFGRRGVWGRDEPMLPDPARRLQVRPSTALIVLSRGLGPPASSALLKRFFFFWGGALGGVGVTRKISFSF